MEKISEGISENIEDGCNIRKPPRLDSLPSCFLQFLGKLKIIINTLTTKDGNFRLLRKSASPPKTEISVFYRFCHNYVCKTPLYPVPGY